MIRNLERRVVAVALIFSAALLGLQAYFLAQGQSEGALPDVVPVLR